MLFSNQAIEHFSSLPQRLDEFSCKSASLPNTKNKQISFCFQSQIGVRRFNQYFQVLERFCCLFSSSLAATFIYNLKTKMQTLHEYWSWSVQNKRIHLDSNKVIWIIFVDADFWILKKIFITVTHVYTSECWNDWIISYFIFFTLFSFFEWLKRKPRANRITKNWKFTFAIILRYFQISVLVLCFFRHSGERKTCQEQNWRYIK